MYLLHYYQVRTSFDILLTVIMDCASMVGRYLSILESEVLY